MSHHQEQPRLLTVEVRGPHLIHVEGLTMTITVPLKGSVATLKRDVEDLASERLGRRVIVDKIFGVEHPSPTGKESSALILPTYYDRNAAMLFEGYPLKCRVAAHLGSGDA